MTSFAFTAMWREECLRPVHVSIGPLGAPPSAGVAVGAETRSAYLQRSLCAPGSRPRGVHSYWVIAGVRTGGHRGGAWSAEGMGEALEGTVFAPDSEERVKVPQVEEDMR